MAAGFLLRAAIPLILRTAVGRAVVQTANTAARTTHAARTGGTAARGATRTAGRRPRVVTKPPAWTNWKEPIKIKITKKDIQQTERLQGVVRDSGRRAAAASGAGRGVKIQKNPSKGVGGVGGKGGSTQAQQMASAISGKRAGLGAVGATAGVMYAYGQMNKPKSGSNVVAPRSGEERRPKGALPPTVARPRPAAGPSSFAGSASVAEGRKAGPSVGAQTKFGSGSGTKGGTTGRVAGSGGGGSVKKPKKMPTVSQSRTMWVKKGTMVGGKEVKKGYVAQYGKAEKRVSAKVEIVTDTESGKKAGETWKYKSGQTVSQVKKKRK